MDNNSDEVNTILVVDDDENNLQLIAKAIYSAGYRIILARDGKSALELCDSIIPDAVLLDIMMPGMSGLEVCRKMRANPNLYDIPIIFLSAAGEDEMIEEGLISGGTDYISKPFSKRVLLARLHSHIDRGLLQKAIQEKNYELALSNQLLVKSEAYLNTIINGSPVAQFVIDIDHRVVLWNRVMEEISGIKAKDIIGTEEHKSVFYSDRRPSLSDLILEGSDEIINRYYAEIARPSNYFKGAYEAVDFFPEFPPEKKGAWLYFTASPITDNNGIVIGAVETIIDLSDLKHTEESLKQVIQKLHLLSGITRHDILNKVTALRGYLSLLQEKPADTESSGYIERAEEIVKTITSLITFTRDYQEIGINSPIWQSINEIIQNVMRSFDIRSVQIETPSDDIEIYGDPLLERVFYNLFDNSLCHGNGITSIRVLTEYNCGNLIIIYEDNGVGVPGNQKENIFCRKYYKNSGFGLFLSREILQITGFSIQETGEYGKGVRFLITVPNGYFRNR